MEILRVFAGLVKLTRLTTGLTKNMETKFSFGARIAI
jgi:hypothetical protein